MPKATGNVPDRESAKIDKYKVLLSVPDIDLSKKNIFIFLLYSPILYYNVNLLTYSLANTTGP